MSSESDDLGHGHSIAAWTSVVVMLVALTVGTIVFYLDIPVAVWVSLAVFVVGGLLWPVLSAAGFGTSRTTTEH